MKRGRALKSADDCPRFHQPGVASLPPHFHVARRDAAALLESRARPRAPEDREVQKQFVVRCFQRGAEPGLRLVVQPVFM